MKLKSYDKKNIYLYLCTTLRNLFGRPTSRKVKRIFLSTKRVYQHLGYTVSRISDSHMKTEVFELSFLERKKIWSYVQSRHNTGSSFYAVNVGTHKKIAERENRINRGYLVVHTMYYFEENRIG